MKMLDMSVYQGDADFKKIKAAGVRYVILRCSSGLKADVRFGEYCRKCDEEGIAYDAYHYAKGDEREAEFVVGLLSGKSVRHVFWDFEEAYFKGNAVAMNTLLFERFQGEMEMAGYKCGIYFNGPYSKLITVMPMTAGGPPVWFAGYPSTENITLDTPVPAYPDKYVQAYNPKNKNTAAWQYSSKCVVPGITANTVDVSEVYNAGLMARVKGWHGAFGTVRSGSRGDGVKVLQHVMNLCKRGIAVDGIFGAITEMSVRAFQQAHGLDVDGIVGKNTWGLLEKLYYS